ncbi:hypothetical protein CAPTEDRAFT_227289 [Capitella teleta]|uniref:Alcohol dehydrogenase-like N-terminal domain-containing protein n=1 Tax=Capitella teleta TaxID=283909 RepID=R7THR8_CAPTE|nr:hypothetical protein CAPTEDRAFT_227289 [Capitella teleta]|eukprot:ELT91106.1 hypothetical protein CAPTEDRAFT_227289 [Capitella teleta]
MIYPDLFAMQGVRLSGGQVEFSSDLPMPIASENEALIRVIRVGICNTDLEVIKGYSGFQGVLGHEFLGIVEKVKQNPRVGVGQRVVGEINLVCDDCANCSLGGFHRRNHCLKRTVLRIVKKNGCMSEFISLPIHNLYVVPEAIPDERAVFAEPLAAAFRIIEQRLIAEGDAVAVIGDGKLGLLITEVMNTQRTSKLTLFGRHSDKMDKITGNFDRVIVGDDTAAKYENMFDVCVEASGKPSGLMTAASVTKPLGTVVLKTTCAADSSSFNTAPFVVKELKIIGSRCGNFQMALNAMEDGSVDPTALITEIYPFAQALKALEHAGTRGVLKIQLKF